MVTTQVYYWQQGDTEWWLVSKFYPESGFTDPYDFLSTVRLVNPNVARLKGGWSALPVNFAVLVPSK